MVSASWMPLSLIRSPNLKHNIPPISSNFVFVLLHTEEEKINFARLSCEFESNPQNKVGPKRCTKIKKSYCNRTVVIVSERQFLYLLRIFTYLWQSWHWSGKPVSRLPIAGYNLDIHICVCVCVCVVVVLVSQQWIHFPTWLKDSPTCFCFTKQNSAPFSLLWTTEEASKQHSCTAACLPVHSK